MSPPVSVRILLLDDDPRVARPLIEWLHNAHYDTVHFATLDPALEHLRHARCDVALVDLALPETPTADLLHDCGTAAEGLRLIGLGAFLTVPDVLHALRNGAHDVLEKPLQQSTVLEAIERQLVHCGIHFRSEEEFNRRLGARLRALRVERGLTLATVAERCNLTAAQLSQIELGKSATSTWTLARISGGLGTTLEHVTRAL